MMIIINSVWNDRIYRHYYIHYTLIDTTVDIILNTTKDTNVVNAIHHYYYRQYCIYI